MAKKKNVGFDKISSMFENLSKKSVIQIDKGREKSYIGTGIYILNALLSKSILNGGVQQDRITIFAGPPQTGKSFICYGLARNAQQLGYNVIYIDTEQSIGLADFEPFGIDTSPKRFMLARGNKVEDLKILLAGLLNDLKKEKMAGAEIDKTMIILDSVGQLASVKEVEDAQEGKHKVDMSRAKAIKSLFRIINADLGYLEIPFICTNHTYKTMDLFPKDVQSGGEGLNYSASAIVYLSIAKHKTGEEDDLDLQSGVVVTAQARKNRLAKPKKVKFTIDWEKGVNPYQGLEYFCTPENFDKVGIAKVKVEKDKKTGEVKVVGSGSKYYVRHLDKSLWEKQIFNSTVFNEDVLNALDPIISEYFTYSSYDEIQKELSIDINEVEENEMDDLSDGELFDN